MSADKSEKKSPLGVPGEEQGQESKGGGNVGVKEQGQAVEIVKAEGDGPVGPRLEMRERKVEPAVSWTVQQGGSPEEALSLPGQVFVTSQLPDPEVQKAAGIDPVQQNAGLIVLDDQANLKHPSGMEPSDVALATKVVQGEPRQPDRLVDERGNPVTPAGLE